MQGFVCVIISENWFLSCNSDSFSWFISQSPNSAHVSMCNLIAFSRNFLAHWCLGLQSRVCAFYHQVWSDLETCIFEPCFGWLILHLNLSSQLQNGQNRAGSTAWRLSFLPCWQWGTWASWISWCSLPMSCCCHSCSWKGNRPSLLLPKVWTKTCGRAGSGVPSFQPHLKRNANGLWQGSSVLSQGWNQTILQVSRWAQCFRVLTRDWQMSFGFQAPEQS